MRKKRLLFAFIGVVFGVLVAVLTGTTFFKVQYADENTTNEEIIEEETSSIVDIDGVVKQVEEKVNEVKNIQVAGTTVGAIAGAVVGAIISAIPSLMNRQNYKKSLFSMEVVEEKCSGYLENIKSSVNTFNNVAKDMLVSANDLVEQSTNKFNDMVAKYDTTLKELDVAKNRLDRVLKENIDIKNDYEELKNMLLTIVANSKEYVASGIAEELAKKFNK